MNHTVTIKYACGHERVFTRVSGGVSDPMTCNCESCQPWDGVAYPTTTCRACGGNGGFMRSDVKRKP